MRNNRKWIGIGIALVSVTMTRQILNNIGGIRSFSYSAQIIIVTLCPIIISLIIRKERSKINDYQYKFLILVVIFINIMAAVVNIIIILNNSFSSIWIAYKDLIITTTLALFVIFTLYIVTFFVVNIKKIK